MHRRLRRDVPQSENSLPAEVTAGPPHRLDCGLTPLSLADSPSPFDRLRDRGE